MNRIYLLMAVLSLVACGSGSGGSGAGASGGTNATVAAALSAIAAAPTGWKTTCQSDAHLYIVTAAGDKLTIEDQYQGNGVCNGTETNTRFRSTFTAASATASGSNVTIRTPTLSSISYMAPTSAVVTDMNSRTDSSGTGVCGKTNWTQNTWVDVTNTICWNFSTAPSNGPGVSSPTTPNAYSHTISDFSFSVSGSTLTWSGLTFTKF